MRFHQSKDRQFFSIMSATGIRNVGRRIANRVVAKPRWHKIDAKDQVVGRLATDISRILVGKHKPTYLPHIDTGDNVVVVNARHVALTGKKVDQKLYRWHTGYVGGLKEENVKSVLERKPEEVLRRAVLGMLPKNRLRKIRARKLRIFPDEQLGLFEQTDGVDKAPFFPRTQTQTKATPTTADD